MTKENGGWSYFRKDPEWEVSGKYETIEQEDGEMRFNLDVVV